MNFSGFGNLELDAKKLDEEAKANQGRANFLTEQFDRMSNERDPKAFAKYIDNQKQLELKRFNCGSGAKNISLKPGENLADEALSALTGGIKGSICKHIEESFNTRLKFAKESISIGATIDKNVKETRGNFAKASGGLAWGLGAVAVKAVWSFFTGVITALLPDPFKGWWIKLVTWINQSVHTLLNFNWNISDAEINRQSLRWVSTAAGQSGEIIGKSIGWIACGLSPVAGVAVVNPEQAALILADVGEEAIDEIASELYALANQVRRGLTNAVFLQLYKGIRSILRNPANVFYKPLVGLFGKDRIDGWGAANSKPWSINLAVNEWIESFNNEGFENFLEELYEGTVEGCTEGFLTFANSASLNLVDRTAYDNRKTVDIVAKEA
jgi:hypothetical protein